MKAIAAIVVAVLLAAPLGAVDAQREVIEQVLVKVNGDIITKTELETRQIAALRERGPDPKSFQNDEELRKALLDVTPRLLVNAIDELLLVQLGREKGYRLTDEQFNTWLTNLRKEQNLQDDAKFTAALKQEGMTMEDLRKNLEQSFLRQRVQQDEVGSKLTITEAEARQYYLAHKNEFVEAASVTLREIFIEIPSATQGGEAGVNVSQADAAKAEAEAVRQRVAGGEDFGKVASEVSDSGSKANGGLIGPLPLADLSDNLRKLLETMKPGDMTQPLPTGKGYQILKVETLKTATPQPFESVRDIVADKVYAARQESEVRKFLARIRTQAIIEWKNDDLRKMYETEIAATKNTTQ
jgi:peptidyl-prolyl cis-trans isomerase SurA